MEILLNIEYLANFEFVFSHGNKARNYLTFAET